MHRIDSATFSDDENGVGKDGFTEGDPGMGIPPTQLTAAWFNDVQEELCNLITANSVTLVKGTQTQLKTIFRTPIGEGANPAIDATGGATNGIGLRGTGGGTTGTGVSGVGSAGGNSIGVLGAGHGNQPGGSFTGGATNANGVNGTGTGTGAGVYGYNPSSGSGVLGENDSTGPAVKGNSTGSGPGVYGLASSAYGVVAEGDTTSPAKAAFRIVPQDAEPSSSPAKGDIIILTGSGRQRTYDGSDWNRVLTNDRSTTSEASVITATSLTAFNQKETLPANSMNAGTVIRVRAFGRVEGSATANHDFTIYLMLGGAGGVALAQFSSIDRDTAGPTDSYWALDVVFTLRTSGASGTGVAHGTMISGFHNSKTPIQAAFLSAMDGITGIDTTIAQDLVLCAQNTNGSDDIFLCQYVVDIT